jgi:hemolysin III
VSEATNTLPFFRRLRDPASGLLHLVGAVLSLIGLFWLLHVARTGWHVAAAAVFGATMVLLYTSSTLYHLLPLSERGTQRLRRVDHSMIYVFIAGSYTPVCLVPLRAEWGVPVLVTIWALAVLGVGLKLFWLEASRWVRIALYLAMGWLSVAILPVLWRLLPGSAFFWLAAGGLAYTIGSLVYALKRPDPFPTVLGFHEIWHLFVMAGTFCHFWLMRDCVQFL